MRCQAIGRFRKDGIVAREFRLLRKGSFVPQHIAGRTMAVRVSETCVFKDFVFSTKIKLMTIMTGGWAIVWIDMVSFSVDHHKPIMLSPTVNLNSGDKQDAEPTLLFG